MYMTTTFLKSEKNTPAARIYWYRLANRVICQIWDIVYILRNSFTWGFLPVNHAK